MRADAWLRGTLGYIRNRKTEKKSHPKSQGRQKIRPKPKTEYKPHWIMKPKNRYYFLRKPDAKNWKMCKPQGTPKPKNRKSLLGQKFWHKNRKTDQKNSQNRISQCPPWLFVLFVIGVNTTYDIKKILLRASFISIRLVTVFTRISAAALIQIFAQQVRRLFVGGAYLNIVPHKFTFSIFLFNGPLCIC